MRKTIFILCTSIFLIVNARSQRAPIKVNEHTVVRDSSGYIYPFVLWQELMFKGSYGLKAVDSTDKHTIFIIYKYTERERIERMEKLPKPKESLYFTNGKKITLFNTTDINNKKLNLKDEKGKIIVLNFWFIDCPPCRMEMPDLNELADFYKQNDSLLFIAVALDKTRDLKDFLEGTAFHYKIVDDGKSIADWYNIKSFPTHVVIDTEGKVYFNTSGLTINTVYWLKKSIEELLVKKSYKN